MNKNVLITGANGFLGKYIVDSFKGFNIYTLGRSNANIICDLSDSIPVIPNIDIVVHCAAKAHVVPKKDTEVKQFYDINVKGTENLIAGIEQSEHKPEVIVYISSVSVYGLVSGNNVSVDSPLLASDPYGKSKIKAEEIIQNWGKTNNINTIILRLPLIIGEPPVGNLKKIISSIKKGYYFRIGKGDAKRSMVLAEDIAQFIPEILHHSGVFNLTDGYHPSLSEIDQKILTKFSIKGKIREFPIGLASMLAKAGDFLEYITKKTVLFNSNKLEKLTSSLTFSDATAREKLGWNPRKVLDHF